MNRSQHIFFTLAAFLVFFGINIVANQTLTGVRIDFTSGRLFTLSAGSRGIISRIDEPVTLRLYFSARQLADVPQLLNYGKRVRDLLEAYAAESKGKIKIQIIDPEPFSEAEDQAVGYGVQQLPISANGEVGYLGLVGTNAVDQETPIPYLNPEREDALEYEITKLIYNLNNPKKRVVGVLSDLPVLGGSPDPKTGQPTSGWMSFEQLKEFFTLRLVSRDVDKIDPDIDTLILVHPKDLPDKTLYALDQFVLGGGKAIVFVDPMAEEDRAAQDPSNPMVMPKIDSGMPKLFEKWGISMAPDQIAGDLDAAVRVTVNSSRGPQEVNYLPWLSLTDLQLNREDFVTSQLKSVNMGAAGILEHRKEAKTTFTPLLTTSPHAGILSRDTLMFVRDPAALLQNFKANRSNLTLAARISGIVETAFPEGAPKDVKATTSQLKISPKPINVIVVADTDVLADRFWVRVERFLNVQVPKPFANNADFLINSVDNLGGNDDLISLRSRGHYTRPFKVVEAIQREAETAYREQEQALQSKLKETETKLRELQAKPAATGEALLTAEQRKEIDVFREEQLKTRKQLRAVQHALQKNIEHLGTVLKFVNIGAIPLLLSLFAIGGVVFRSRRA